MSDRFGFLPGLLLLSFQPSCGANSRLFAILAPFSGAVRLGIFRVRLDDRTTAVRWRDEICLWRRLSLVMAHFRHDVIIELSPQ